MIDLAGKSIIVTGGSSGMGRATSLLAAKAGARVTIGDLNDTDGKAVVGEIVASGGEAHFVKTDVSIEREVEALIEAAIDHFGSINGAFNNAAISGVALPLHEISAEGFRRTQDVNLHSVFFCLKHEVRAMMARNGGSIVNNSAAGSVVAVPNIADYAASKAAINSLTRSAAVEYAGRNIRVNAIYPGTIDTPMSRAALSSKPEFEAALLAKQPIGRLGTPSEVAHAVLFLLSDLSSFITGAFLPVDGGFIL